MKRSPNIHPLPQLARRTFLRGAGVTLALPFLEAMLPGGQRAAEAALISNANTRLGFVFIPNGCNMAEWLPKSSGALNVLSPTLAPLNSVKDKVLVLSELSQHNGNALGDGAGDHARSAASFLTGAHPVKTNGADLRNGASIDQIAAEKLGQTTKLPSLELSIERGRHSGECDSGYSCAYSNTVSWKTPTLPVAREVNPRLVFERMFGAAGEDLASQKKRNHFRKSILDAVRSDADKLNARLGKTDQRKVDEYFTSVREIEERIMRLGDSKASEPTAELTVPEGVPGNLEEHIQIMFDLMVEAYRTNTTRVVSFMMANEGTNRSYPMLGVNDGHHHLSHHQRKADWLRQLAQIDKYHVTHFARFLEKLNAVSEGEGTLLDNSLIVFGAGLSDGDRHNHNELPIVLAGGKSVGIQGGRHVAYGKDTPLNNLFLSLVDKAGVGGLERFGDSTGRLDQLEG